MLSKTTQARISACNVLGKPVSLPRYILEEQRRLNLVPDELSQLFNNIQTVAKTISAALRNIEPPKMDMLSAESINRDYCSTLDTVSSELFIDTLRSSHTVCMLISDRSRQPIEVDTDKRGKYIVCFVAMDNASNIECHIPLGSVFAIYKKTSTGAEPTVKDVLQPGRNVVASGYVMYGCATILVMSMGKGVQGFTLCPNIGEFLLTDPDIRVIPRGFSYSVNEGSMYQWDSAVAEYVESKKSYKVGKPYRAHYMGSVAADVHQTLTQGGIYINPSTKDFPSGRLGLLYEGIPMAFLVDQAGGLASDGKTPILDIVPENIHQKAPILLGSREDVRDIVMFYKKDSTPQVHT